MIRLPNNGMKTQYPRIVNTPERKDIVLLKSMAITRYISRSKRILEFLDVITKTKDLPYKKRMKYKRKIVVLVKQLGVDFVEVRRLETRLCEYDEMQRLKYYKVKARVHKQV